MSSPGNGRSQNFALDFDATEKAFEDIKLWRHRVVELPTETPYFYNMVMSLLDHMLRQRHYLGVGYKKLSILLAWACRNLLELRIYTRYALQSSQNCKDFADDMWVDAIQIFEALKGWIQVSDPGIVTPILDETIADFRNEKRRRGISRKKYLDVRTISENVGLRQEFTYMNKVLSKLVHPTAFSVLTPLDHDVLNRLKLLIFNAGVEYALDIYVEIKSHVDNYGMEPK
ncbi:MAG: hypothetical protein ACR2JB_25035 [Bryobacteraceae bacterium]